jgi:hypothetical protein
VAQTSRRRRKKHRGTQGGSIDRRGRTTRPRNRQEARARARKQLGDRRDQAPTWGGAVKRAAFGAVIFEAVLYLLLDQPLGESIGLAALMFLLYVPLAYYMERFFYARRQAQQRREREERRAARG